MSNQLKLYQILFFVVLFLLLYVLFTKVLSEYGYMFELIGEYSRTSDLLKDESNWKEKSITLKRDINRYESEIAAINLDLPADRELSKPLHYIDSLINRKRITLQKIQLLSIDTTRQYQFVELQVNLRSRFDRIKGLLSDLEMSSLIITVKRFKFKLLSFYRRDIEAEIGLTILFKRAG